MECPENVSDRISFRVVRSDGEEFAFGRGGWMVTNDGLENFANLSLKVNTSANVLRDGSSLVSKRVEETDRTIKAEYRGEDPDAARMRAITFFNPRFTFRLYATYRGYTRFCEGEQTGFKATAGNIYKDPDLAWTLLCLDPFWKSVDRNERELGDSNPYIGWPYVSHILEKLPNGEMYPFGNPVSILVYDGKNTITNNGDAPVYYKVRIRAHGKLVNPTVTKDQKFVKVLTTLNDGDILALDFESMPPKVTVNDENAIKLCSRDSNFTGMRMEVGDSVFSFSVDNSENRELADVQILFHKSYVGL